MTRRLTPKQKTAIALKAVCAESINIDVGEEYEVSESTTALLALELSANAHKLFVEDDHMDLPPKVQLPLFVYGALKPGMPAFESIRRFVAYQPKRNKVEGELFVRDGLPLLSLNGHDIVEGFVVDWHEGQKEAAYRSVCEFEPRKHYVWCEVELSPGRHANVLGIRYPGKGNPQRIYSTKWQLTDDPAFGKGMATIRDVINEIEASQHWDAWQRFFRAQMAYLLLWSILERLSALCFGPGHDPMQRVKQLHELRGMPKLLELHVHRSDEVSDSRDPDARYRLDPSNAKKCFDYYYQVRSNLSHRGKAVHSEVDKVTKSLTELFAVTEGYLRSLPELEEQL